MLLAHRGSESIDGSAPISEVIGFNQKVSYLSITNE